MSLGIVLLLDTQSENEGLKSTSQIEFLYVFLLKLYNVFEISEVS